MKVQARGVHGGIGLAALRCALGPATLVTTASDHVAIRTPSRPDFARGNVIDLFEPPSDLDAWQDRCDRTLGAIAGYQGARVRWQLRASEEVRPDVVMTDIVDLSKIDRVAVPDSVVVRDADTDTLRAGAMVQFLHAGAGDRDITFWKWLSAEQDFLVHTGRGRVLVAHRQGIPIGRGSAFHDAAGLALVCDVVVHPLHRGIGVGRALTSLLAAWTQQQGAITIVQSVPSTGPRASGSWLQSVPHVASVATASRGRDVAGD